MAVYGPVSHQQNIIWTEASEVHILLFWWRTGPCNDIIGSAKGSQISKKCWGEVGKGKRADVYLEVRKRRGHIFFEWNKCLWNWLIPKISACRARIWSLWASEGWIARHGRGGRDSLQNTGGGITKHRRWRASLTTISLEQLTTERQGYWVIK